MTWSDMHDGSTGWLAASGWMLALWVVVAVVVVAVTRGGRDGPRAPDLSARRDPLQLLDERFARGEIDADEYQERRALLREPH